LITDFGCSKNAKSYSDEENKNTNSEVVKNMISQPYYASSEQLSSNKAHASYDI
jgi:serine/threonine protein kinase